MSIKWHSLGIDETLKQLATHLESGLLADEVKRRKKLYLPNKIDIHKKDSVLLRFLRQFNNMLIYILLVAVVITAYLEQWVDASVIFGVVIINAIFGFFQEGKAEKALGAIRAMLSPTALVIRGGKQVTIPASELLPGDVVLVNRGDKVPADLRLCEAKNLQVEEAVLTGESLPAEKQTLPVAENAMLGERFSMLYSGTLVTDGRGLGVVVATGIDTEVGKIGEALGQAESITTPLLRQMNQFGSWLTLVIIVLAAVVFLVGALVWHNVSCEMFMAIVGLTVAAIPEGLPPIMTIILAIGVTEMAKLKAIVRNLPAVETMGAVTTICTDKTGTLTCNELAVQSIITAKHDYHVNKELQLAGSQHDLQTAIISAVLCNDAILHYRGDLYETSGNPIDEALMLLGVHLKFDVRLCQQKFPRTDLIPYETEHKFMATLHHDHAGRGFVYVKGAPEIILKKCSEQQANGEITPLDVEYWHKNIEKLASLGQRVIAVATHKAAGAKQTLSFDDVNDDLVLVALFGLIDPPREEAIAAVKECQQAGINVKMITGDHVLTARTIALSVGIKNPEVLTGEMIDKMSDEELDKVAQRIDIYARTAPYHKLRLVKALQRQGEVVAMTGDGINDAPALKQADIGVAMGKGADLAKESAAMVLADDNFATIEHAVREGRIIFDNLQKAILFILPTSFAQAFAVVVAILFGLTLPITAVQILWVNMITAVTLSLALGFEPADSDVMDRPPRDPKQPLLSWYLLWRSFSVSLILVAVVFGLFIFISHLHPDLGIARTVVVNAFVFGEVVYLINCRNLRKSSFNLSSFFGSKPVLIAIGIVAVFQLLFTYVPIMQYFFDTVAIGFTAWGYIILSGVITFGLIELEKMLFRS